ADPNEGALLVHAVRRGRPPEVLRLLAEAGAELDRRGGEWSTPPEQHKSAYENAVLRGRDDYVRVLEELGASTDVSPEDRAVGAVARGERPETPLPAELSADAQEVLILQALWGDLELVVDLLLDAGAELEPRLAEVAEGPLAEWLGPRGRPET